MGLFDFFNRPGGFVDDPWGASQGPWSRTDSYGGYQGGGRSYPGGFGNSGLGPLDPSIFGDLRAAHGAFGVLASAGRQSPYADSPFSRGLTYAASVNEALGVLPRAVCGVADAVGGLLRGLGSIFSGGGRQDPYGRGCDVGPAFRQPGFFSPSGGFGGPNEGGNDRFETRVPGFVGRTSVSLEGVFPPQRNAAIAALSDVVSGVQSALREPLRRYPNAFSMPSVSIDGRGNVKIKLAFESEGEIWETSVTVSARQTDRQSLYKQIQDQVGPSRWRRAPLLSGDSRSTSDWGSLLGSVQGDAPGILPQLPQRGSSPWVAVNDGPYQAPRQTFAPGVPTYGGGAPGRNSGLSSYLAQTNGLMQSLLG